MDHILCVYIILIYNVADVLSTWCSYGNSYISCDYGCCGTTYDRYCCPRSSYTYRKTTMRLSSGVSAAIGLCVICFFAAVVIAAICYKKKYHGRVLRAGTVGPHHLNTIQVMHTTTTMAGPAPQPYPMYPPPSYAQMPPPMQPIPSPMHGAPSQPGYVPPPPAYSAPSQANGAQPLSYKMTQNYPGGQY